MNRLMSAAVGDVPFDRVLTNACIVNVYTGEVYPGEIGIVGDRIAYVSEPNETGLAAADRYDCGGRFVLPGLIDTHVHMESGMMTPANFARTVIPHGTTTILADPHEFCNVLGLEGMAYCAEASRDILLRVLLAAPSCVPSMPGESNKMAFGPDEVGRLLDVPAAAALGEVMDYVGVVRQDDRMMSILAEARKRGKIIQGHIINPTARELAAYMAAGVESDHESRLTDEALRKLRTGMVLECRNGSSARNIAALAPALKAAGYPVNATLATDDREPDDLLHDGHIDEAIRQAVRAGVPPVHAIQMATRNAALFLGRKDIGGLKPGRWRISSSRTAWTTSGSGRCSSVASSRPRRASWWSTSRPGRRRWSNGTP
ncbi:MAG: amidohydrolase family protein [Planctomycetaceae bacterium]|nr:amidohydrolase family protein [Planctomycetaceae bacterium]